MRLSGQEPLSSATPPTPSHAVIDLQRHFYNECVAKAYLTCVFLSTNSFLGPHASLTLYTTWPRRCDPSIVADCNTFPTVADRGVADRAQTRIIQVSDSLRPRIRPCPAEPAVSGKEELGTKNSLACSTLSMVWLKSPGQPPASKKPCCSAACRWFTGFYLLGRV